MARDAGSMARVRFLGGAPMIFRCTEGHGRVLHIGHYACANDRCGKKYKHHPPSVCACGGRTFLPACAQCFEAERRVESMTAE